MALPYGFQCMATRESQSRQAFASKEPMVVGTEGARCRSIFIPIRNCRGRSREVHLKGLKRDAKVTNKERYKAAVVVVGDQRDQLDRRKDARQQMERYQKSGRSAKDLRGGRRRRKV
ncbi:hypothetical protein TNCV_1921331 [Trichonephila clavipes]|nr:hypothetical protein TNCV_1921331 [Trichonephila clavipes]